MLNAYTTVVDANKCKMYMKNFGEFFNDQIEHASSIILSHTDSATDEKTEKCISLIKEHNKDAIIVATPWDKITGSEILLAMERENTLETELEKLKSESAHHKHHHCDCHDHHHADEVFTSWGTETTRKYTMDKIKSALDALPDSEKYGVVLRAKGIVECECGKWIHFDYVPGEPDVRCGSASVIGRICVIGSKINEEEIKKLFN